MALQFCAFEDIEIIYVFIHVYMQEVSVLECLETQIMMICVHDRVAADGPGVNFAVVSGTGMEII